MAQASVPSIKMFNLNYDLCTALKLESVRAIDTGMCGDIVLTKFKGSKYVVKKFTLLHKETKDRNIRTFFTEVKLMQSLDHPFVMKCIFAGRCPEYLAICMDYCQRGTLINCVGEISLDVSERCVTQVACALRYLHTNNVVHLDVKLKNIFVGWDFKATLGDFGLAVKMAPQQKMLVKRQCGGTLGYIAPEWIETSLDKDIDPYKLDSYCLGVVLWALVLKRYPHQNLHYFFEAWKRRDVPSHLRSWLLKLLVRCPSERPTVTDFLARMRREGAYRNVIDNN